MKRFFTLLCLLLATALSLTLQGEERQLAFPGAAGYAQYITGGRGGQVYYVTSLSDCSDDNLVPGTLRWALRTGDDTPRTILFAVHGTIYLESKLKTNHANVSILGQSAPGGGVCITGYPIVINNRNYIIRYLRFRAGDIPALESEGNESYAGLDIENAAEVILDHCSVTWSMEECLTMFDNDTTTVQYCIIGEGLYHSYNIKTTGDDSGRAFAMQWGGDHSNMHHVLITNCAGRAPRFNGVREKNAWLPGSGKQYAHDCHIDGDFANNVFYNWGGSHLSYYGGEFYASYFSEAPAGLDAYNRIWMRNNYFRPGPSTQKNGANFRHFFHPSGDADNQIGQWYLSGNKFELSSYYAPKGTYWSDSELQKVNADNLAGFGTAATALDLNASYKAHLLNEIPYALSPYQPVSADEAYLAVTDASRGAGANLPRYDEEDQRLVDEAGGRRDGVAPCLGSRASGAAKRPGIIDTPSDVTFQQGNDSFTTAAGHTYSCYPSLAMKSGERFAVDSDGDGMPDAYETAVGLDPKQAADGAQLASNGFTNLENYLNGLADFSLSNADYQTSAEYVEPGLASRPETVTISFAKSSVIQGSVPAPRTVGYGDVVVFNPSWSLYREGYTMTGWTDGNMTYHFGEEYRSFVQDVTLYPMMEKNNRNLSDRTDDIVITWDFASEQAPKLGTGEGIFVTRGWIDRDSLDVCLRYQELTLTLPADAGAIATVAYRSGESAEYAAIGNSIEIALSSHELQSVSISIPYIFDPTGISFHTPQVGHCLVGQDSPNSSHAAGFDASAAAHYELIYGDTLTVDAISWMETVGQHRNGYRNCVNPLQEEKSYSTDGAPTIPLQGFIVGQSYTSTYRLVAYVKDCARVRTYASGSNSIGDQMLLTAIPADGSERITAQNLHLLTKSGNLSESFDIELDPEKSYKLVWSSVAGYDMVVGAIRLYDKTSVGAKSGDAQIFWNWNGTPDIAAAVDPSKAFASTCATVGANFTKISSVELNDGSLAVSMKQDAKTTVRDAGHMIEFKVSPAGGYTFQPTHLSFYAQMTATSAGNLDVYVQQGNGEERLLKGYTYNGLGTKQLDLDLEASKSPLYIRFYCYNLAVKQYMYLKGIVIEGKYVNNGATKYGFTTQVTPAGAGVITQTPKGAAFVPESEITLSATPVAGYQFVGWSDAAGNLLSTSAKYVHTKQVGDEQLTAQFRDLSDSEIFRDGPFQAIVSNAEELADALTAASQSSRERYYIFLRNGIYDFGEKAMTAVPHHTSLIGESQAGVLIFNTPSAQVADYQNETPVLYIAPDQHEVYMQDLTIRQARDWGTKVSQGQAIALRQRGKQAIFKQVTLQGVQDTYYLNKADGTAYFEDCTLAGEVDFIYGDGTAFFQHCTLHPVSSAAYITAPNTQPGALGMVFEDCTIARPSDAKDAVTGYRLGRPWGDSPAATFLHTTMQVLPASAGWGSMSTGLVLRFHEYGSKDAEGRQLDLSARSLAACQGDDASDKPVLTEAQTAAYALDKVFPDWSPAVKTVQVPAPVVSVQEGRLSWTASDKAMAYAIVCDGEVIDFVVNASYDCPRPGQYAVRAVNRMGGLGPVSAAVASDASSISEMEVEKPNSVTFDLLGRRVSASARGLLIRNGKPVIR